jgi:hypothetical protein
LQANLDQLRRFAAAVMLKDFGVTRDDVVATTMQQKSSAQCRIERAGAPTLDPG